MICPGCRGRGFRADEDEDDGGVCSECRGAGTLVSNPFTELMGAEGLSFPEAVERLHQERNER
jgi:hypothetical protein